MSDAPQVVLAGGAVGQREVLAVLTYDADGTPVAICAGKSRQRATDAESLLAWLMAFKAQIEGLK